MASFEDRFLQLYQRLLVEGSEYSAKLEEASGTKNVCSAGCGYCCYQSIEVYNFELFTILHYLKKTKNTGFLKSASEAAKHISKELPEVPFKDDPEEENPRDILKFKLQYRGLNMPCIFLEDGRCSIYSVRPINCSTYFSYGDKEKCGVGILPPAECTAHEETEEHILEKLIDFIHENDYDWSFDPFGIEVLPIGLDKYK